MSEFFGEDFFAEVRKAIESFSIEDFRDPDARIRMGPTGFDAKTIRDRYVERVIARPVTPSDKPIAELGGIKFYSKCQLEDLYMFICLFLTYGNDLNKVLWMLKNSRTIRIKCKLYGIKTASKQRKLKPNQLSLYRIALAFPIRTAMVILHMKPKGVLPYSAFFEQNVPLLMQHTVFPCLIPAEKFTEELKGITSVLNMEISVDYHIKKNELLPTLQMGCLPMEMENETVEQMVESSAKYVDSAIKNGIEDGIKLEILTKAGILEVNTDGELELSAGIVALVNKLADLKAVFSVPYYQAIGKLIFGKKS